jgi:hypothetical protein
MSINTDNSLEMLKQYSNVKLNPELQKFVVETEIGKYIKHPLVFSPLVLPGLANQMLEQKNNQLRKALDTKNFSQYVFLHERPYRVSVFKDIKHELTDENYWKLLSSIWTDTENSYQDLGTWKNLFKSKRGQRHNLMTEDELNTMESLDDTVTIFRGCVKNLNEDGLSWTLDKERAEWFANRFDQEGIVIEKAIGKEKIVAYFGGRGEEEIIVI